MTQKNKKLLFGIISGLIVFLVASYYADTPTQIDAEGQGYSQDTSLDAEVKQYDIDNYADDDEAVESEDIPTESKIPTNAKVVKVVDGDTIDAVVDTEPNKTYRVRLLGINTPETVDPRRPVECFGKESSDFAKKLLNDKRIYLQSDPEADEIDRYGRLLRNVFLADGTDFNAIMIERGYAYAYVSFPQNKARKAELRALEQSAKSANRGLWNPEICP